jgi:hypothetical protein
MKLIGEDHYVSEYGSRLIIKQDTSLANRKTVTYVPLGIYCSDFYGSWNSIETFHQRKIKVDDYDGTKKFTLQMYLWSPTEGTAQGRLYDITAAAEVAGSLVETNSPTPVLLESAELTLDATHEYQFEVKAPGYYFSAYAYNPQLKITQSGFTKTASIPIQFGMYKNYPAGTYLNQFGQAKYEPDDISAEDGITYQMQCRWKFQEYSEHTVHARVYDITHAAAIAGTTHEEVRSAPADGVYEDTPTMPDTEANIINQIDQAADYETDWYMLFAMQEEALPAAPSLPADPSQPSGYHCFMNQWLRNIISGHIPLKTPDGVNQCW